MDEQKRNDNELFDALKQSKIKKRRRRIRRVLIVLAVIALLLFLLVSSLQRRVREVMSSRNDEVLSCSVAYGTVSTTVSGSGTIADVDAETVTVPAGVEILEVTAEANSRVQQGDVLATVDMATVMNTLSNLQGQIEEKDKALAEASKDKVSSAISAGVAGRVKKIYAQKGDDVAACMVRDGALALLSQDGYMALELEGTALQAGDKVSVVREDGSALPGTVDSAANGTAVILVTDRGPALDEQVTVQDAEGAPLGSGTLYIHNPLRITGYAGTVSRVAVKEEQSVWAGSTLFTLSDTATSARYDAILKERRELEETMLELLSIHRSGALCAPFAGTVLSIEHGKEETPPAPDGAQAAIAAYTQSTAAAVSDSAEETKVLILSRDVEMSVTIPVDESDILALELGQEAELTIDSIGPEPYSGVVTEIDRTASGGAGVTAYAATITFDKAEHMLGGMTADVSIAIGGTENVLVIPTAAVHKTSASAYVYTSYDTDTGMFGDPRTVTLGVSAKDLTEIRSGLQEGEVVYYMEIEDPFEIFMQYNASENRGNRP